MRTNKYLKLDENIELELCNFIENSNQKRAKKRALAILMSNNRLLLKHKIIIPL